MLTSNQKTSWNDFVDHTKSMGVEPDADYLPGFKKDNPDSKLEAEHIPVALNDVAAIKSNPNIPGLTPAYKAGGNLKYPVTAKGKPLDFGGNPSAIPAPNFDDPKAVQNYRNALHSKYPGLNEREDLPEYLNTTYENEKTPVKEAITKAAQTAGIRPELLYASSMEEGMRGLFPTDKNKGQIDYSGDEKHPISGFTNFGLDRFADMYPELEKKGYLPKGFDQNFAKSQETNEKKEKVNSANFKDLPSAIQAKAAVMKYTADNVQAYAKDKGIELSPKAQEFFNLIGYNAGEGSAKKMMESYKAKGYLKNDDFISKQPDSSWSGPYKNVQKRVAAADALKNEGLF